MAKVTDMPMSHRLNERLTLELTYHELFYLYLSIASVKWGVVERAFGELTPKVDYSPEKERELMVLLESELHRKGFDA